MVLIFDLIMKSKLKNIARKELSVRIEHLHNMGYSNDYVLTTDRKVSCLQDRSSYCYDQVTMQLIDHVYDDVVQQFCHIHTVSTNDGQKGIILSYSEAAKPRQRYCGVKRTAIDAFWEAY
jgi:hypothetical protein